MAAGATALDEAGENSLGSAFYRIDSADITPAGLANSPTAANGPAPLPLVTTHAVGPAAAGFRTAGSGIDKARAQQCLAMAVHYEAASESLAGQRAVAQVVLNRVGHPSYPNTVCGVVFQGSERRTGCQFTFTCDGSLARRPEALAFARAHGVARAALAGSVSRDVGLATHYHTIWINPYWASSLDSVGVIGAHRFYRWRGSAGRPPAFRMAYRGSEPLARPAPSVATVADRTALLEAEATSIERILMEARAAVDAAMSAPIAPAPDDTPQIGVRGGDGRFTAGDLPPKSAVRPEYRGERALA